VAEPLQLLLKDPGADVSDDRLAERLAQGDVSALDAVLRRHWSSVTTFAERALGDADAASDVSQETFIRLWQHRGDIQPGLLRAFIFRTVRNLVLDTLRRRAVRRRWALFADPPATAESPAIVLEASETQRVIARAVAALPDRRRASFTLAYLHDLSYKEVAVVLGVSVATVKNQVAAALAQLRATLADERRD
jgi:RNA polymerase sigma-70 factor (ECF subfamily)